MTNETPANIFPAIPAASLAQAQQNFPPASVASSEFMQGETTDCNGRAVIVTFKRHLFKEHKAQWYAWQIFEAEYVGES